MTFQEVKKWLQRAYRIQELIDLDKEKIKELEELALSIPALEMKEKIQTSKKNEATFEEKVFNKSKRMEQLKKRILEREIIKQEIDIAINKLEDNEYIEILEYRYLKFLTFRDIASKTYMSVGKCFNLHDKAIRKLCKILK